MTRVFIGGSRRLDRLTPELAQRLRNIMDRRLRVLVGDASGFDRAAQVYLADNGYRDVTVYCTGGTCRNIVGPWLVVNVEYAGRTRDRAFFTAKDDAMLQEADFGLFAWDGRSKGTLRNVLKMAERQRPSSVFISTLNCFATVRTIADAQRILDLAGTEADIPGLFTSAWSAAEAAGSGHLEAG